MLRHVTLVRTDVSEDPGASFATSVLTRVTRRNNPEDTILLVSHLVCSSIPTVEVTYSSEMFGCYRATQHYIQKTSPRLSVHSCFHIPEVRMSPKARSTNLLLVFLFIFTIYLETPTATVAILLRIAEWLLHNWKGLGTRAIASILDTPPTILCEDLEKNTNSSVSAVHCSL
jgi:hypothetical protein